MADDEEAAVLTVGVWEVYLSDGRPYFFKNDGSDTTQWNCPEELKGDPRVEALLEAGGGSEEEGEEEGEVEDAEQEGESQGGGGGKLTPDGAAGAFGSSGDGWASPVAAGSYGEGGERATAMEGADVDDGEESGEWGEARDEETGQIYYFNRRDGTTTWDPPEGFVSKLAELGEDMGGYNQEWNREEGELEEGEMGLEMEEEEEEDVAAAEQEAAVEAGQGQWGQHARARWGGDGGEREEEEEQPAPEEQNGQRMMTTAEYEAQQYRAKVEQLRRKRAAQAEAAVLTPSAESAVPVQRLSPEGAPSRAPAAPRPVSQPSLHEEQRPASPNRQKRRAVEEQGEEQQQQQQQQQQREEEEEPEPDPRAELERARARLAVEDALMEPQVLSDVMAYINEYSRLGAAGQLLPEEAKRGADKVVGELLATGYRGLANMAVLAAGWLQGLSGDGTLTLEQDLEADELVLEHLGAQVRHRFDVDKADALLFGRRQDMAFIDEMMAHARWRRLLMEIFAEHRESKLLGGYCMQHMSRAGHNTEMADIISVEDYWSVARGVLTELMAEVPWADHVALFKLLGNLKRICCSTAYLHAFSQEVLRRLEDALAQQAAVLEEQAGGGQKEDGDGSWARQRQQSVIAAQRKYRRIREELERASWEAAAGGHDRGRSRFVHKLSAWQRGASKKERDAATAPDPAAEEKRRQLVETLLGAFCERALSDRELETLQAFYVDERLFKERSGGRGAESVFGGTGLSDDEDDDEDANKLITVKGPLELLRHPQLLDLLIRALFDPKRRLSTTERRAAACKLLAVASTALLDGSVARGDAEALRRDLHEASELLAEEATLHWNMATSATPAALKRLLQRWPVVAMGFLHWLRATIQDPEFHNSRQFNEVMAVFMRLLQHLVVARPLHQPAVFAALRVLLLLKPTESSFQIIRMKRQALQCCVFLMAHGFVLPVLSFFHGVVKDLDHALVRHFVGLLLAVAKPPYSPVFARGLAALLREEVVSKALRSSDLDASHRRALVAFIEAVSESGDDGDRMEDGDVAQQTAGTPVTLEQKKERDGDGKGDNGDHMDVDGGEKEGNEGGKGPPPLLDPAMRKGLRLVYAQVLNGGGLGR